MDGVLEIPKKFKRVDPTGKCCEVYCGYAKIYSLSDNNDNVFYIGCTSTDLKTRYQQHLLSAKNDKIKCKRSMKIRELNHEFKINEIDRVYIVGSKARHAVTEAYKVEAEWIAKYIINGHALTNSYPRSSTRHLLVPPGETFFKHDRFGYSIIQY